SPGASKYFSQSPMGRRTVLFTNSSSPCQFGTLLWMASSVITVKHTETAPCTPCTQLTH
ncbi:unnamed protein product, partial [Staurois parvus]